LQFLHRFIAASGKSILDYAVDIKDACYSIFNSEKYSDVRCATFSILRQLLELTASNIDVANRLNLKDLIDKYFLSLSNKSKITSSSILLIILLFL
jgi:hypothetical protein